MWFEQQPWSTIIKISVIIVISLFLIMLFRKIFDRSVARHIERGNSRLCTLAALLRSTVGYVIGFIAIMMVLQAAGVNVAPILASAGIIGLAVGFGAQSLIKDIISGFFILFENVYSVGDYIQVGSLSGFCEELGLRTTRLRDWGGELHVIPNGQIAQLTNLSRGNLNTYIEIPVPYNEDLPFLLGLIERASAKLRGKTDKLISGPTILGVDKLEETRVIIKMVFTSALADRSSLGRKLRQACKEEFDAAEVEMPVFLSLVSGEKGKA
ncbi:MAG: mechanosensitive ion channel family protein [Clostridiales bacterium]|nr:mechanosensitive ion channel family protein [Clostridiales bacterium]